jgi:hypothetical protein
MTYKQRRSVLIVEVVYLVVLLLLALVYLTDLRAFLHFNIPDKLGSLPVGVPWFGAVGAVMISLSGVFDHRDDWDPAWNLWHFTRPLVGATLAIVSWLIFEAGILAVGSNPNPTPANGAANQAGTAPKDLLYYIIAFVVGYREEIFRDLIKRVADVILTPSGGAKAPVVSALIPTSGAVAGGTKVTITGSGLTGATSVKFGPTAAASFTVDSDHQITATTPPGTGAGAVKITVTTKAGSVTAGDFTYV